jgi:lipopolysaccharide transport system ATP-binding protein
MTTAIQIDGLSKRYRIDRAGRGGAYSYRTLRDSLASLACLPLRRWRGPPGGSAEDFWALRDVTLEVKSGEVTGILGRNGAGKSTLLKILSRITKPTSGQVRLRGRVGSLLEVGTGFHPELTGRENVYLNGAILGMSRREVSRKFDEIVAFAGVEDFLDTPVKRYSSGMYVRLAFAVAAHLEPEILLVDEVLAVGDYAFQKKCAGRMSDIAESGRTVLLVSHDLPMLAKLSTSAVWIDGGRVKQLGTPTEVIKSYCEEVASSVDHSPSVDLSAHPGRRAGMTPLLRRVSLFDSLDRPLSAVPLGGSFTIDLELDDLAGESDTTLMVYICDMFGTSLAQLHSKVQSSIDLAGLRRARARCTVEDFRLVPGEYTLHVAVGDSGANLDRVDNALSFSVLPANIYDTGKVPRRKDGLVALTARWELSPAAHGGVQPQVGLAQAAPGHAAPHRARRVG